MSDDRDTNNISADDPDATIDDPAGKPPVEATLTEADIDRANVTISEYLDKHGLRGGVELNDSDGTATGALRDRQGRKYDLGKIIAQGGMGAVLDAKDHCVRRHVAMKVMHKHQQSPERVVRFIEEAQVTGQLEHPSIVPVHELGVDGSGNVFYTMKFVHGRTLKDVLRDIRRNKAETVKDFPLSRLLSIFLRVCDAVAFAHSKGVVHRDLKPENIMLGDYGEVLVVDWGLAKVLGKDASTTDNDSGFGINSDRRDAFADGAQTMAGQIMGTPSFMPPEQAAGRVDDVDERSDIYALGSVLYNILTLHPPVRGENVTEILQKVAAGEITNPSLYGKSSSGRSTKAPKDLSVELHHCQGKKVPASLSAVAMKALSVKREDRYQSVQLLQKDVQAYLDGFATLAEHANLVRQCILLFNRNKKQAISLTAAAVVLLAVTIGFVIQLNQKRAEAQLARDRAVAAAQEAHDARALAEDARTVAEEAQAVAEERSEETRRTLYASEMHRAYSAIDNPAGVARVKATLDRWRPSGDETDLRGWEWYYMRAQYDQSEWHLLHEHKVTAACWSGDGRHVFTIDKQGYAHVWDSLDGRHLRTLKQKIRWVGSIACNPAGGQLATLTGGGNLRIHDPETGRIVRKIKLEGVKYKRKVLAFSPDGQQLVAPDGSKAAVVLDAATGKVIRRTPLPGAAYTAEWHADGERIAFACGKKLVVWNTRKGVTQTFSDDKKLTSYLRGATWDAQGRVLVMLEFGLWRIDPTGGEIRHLGGVPLNYNVTIHYSSAAGMLAYLPGDRGLYLSDLQSGRTLVLKGHAQGITDVKWDPQGQRIMTLGEDGVRLWNHRAVQSAYRDGGEGYGAAWRPGDAVFAVGMQNEVQILAMPNAELIHRFPVDGSKGCTAAWSPDGDRLVIVTEKHLSLRSYPSGELLWQVDLGIDGVEGGYALLSWEPGGERILYRGFRVPDAFVFSAADGSRVHQIKRKWVVMPIGWDPAGGRLAYHLVGKEITVANLDRPGDVITWPIGHGATALTWHPAGDVVVTSRGGDNLVELWSVADGERIASFIGGEMVLRALAWSPDGTCLAVGDSNGTIQLWDYETRQVVLTIKHSGGISQLAWDSSGTRLAVSGFDEGQVTRIYDAVNGYVAENDPAALDWVDQHIALEPEHVRHHAQRARLLEAMGRNDEAAQVLENIETLKKRKPTPKTPRVHGEPSRPKPAPAKPVVKKTAKERQAEMHQRMDANSDGKVTLGEYVGLFADSFPTQNKNGDGGLTEDEMAHPSAFKAMDKDQDGLVTLDEFKQLYAGQFTNLDKNGDGFWTVDEI